ncbi:AMP-binding protein [Oceanimonas doudoroffii]|uniref:Uncharacterized protein n=1 Tax=Oceanimonas doudoroffii TaxID=84158 RepID=A0A233RCB6_9GAMM|nr:AMP-binding protein [Oceanimonas doudoroffii]OXY81029.1 hypothetical protein B6S08_15020 [Oceanimonas doudoroffii]
MSALIPLSDWLRQAPERPVAVGADGMVSRRELEARVAWWYRRLPARPGQRWALYHQDTVEFAAMLLALWQRGSTVCLPGDNRPATHARLQPRVAGFAGQFPGVEAHYRDAPPLSSSLPDWQPLTADFPALELYTSGSTGAPKPIVKTVAQLESELAALERRWPGPEEARAVVVATVSHQHLYGLTFRLLWPLCRGQLFEAEICQLTEDVFRRARRYPHFVLVSTPSHLSRLNPALDWHSLRLSCHAVLSSAAPLQRADSLRVAVLLDAQIREIYGSSETGAVAWRVQTPTSEAGWRPLPGLDCELTPEGRLLVTGPQLEGGRQLLADRATLSEDGGFALLGRADRIVKIEGKRISLAEVEQVAEEQPLIKIARALALSRRRTEIALVAELTPEGRQFLQTRGKPALVRRLREAFARHFEPVALPRRWRFTEQMPYNQQGKITVDSLMAMFRQQDVKWPEVLGQTITGRSADLALAIPATLIYFDGHFAGNPILPGITQVHWAEHYGRTLLGVEGTFCRLEVAKFQQVIFPDARVTLGMEYQADRQKLAFRYFSDKGVHSSGRICFS